MGQFFVILRGNPGEPLRRWINEIPNNGLIRYLDIFNLERVAVIKPKALADVLVYNSYDFEKPAPLRKGISRILGMGLFLAEGDLHRQQRKNLMPAFAFRHIKDLHSVFRDKSKELVEAIMHEINDTGESQVEVSRWASRSTLDIIGLAGMGGDFNAIANPDSELLNTYRSIFSPGRAGRLLAVAGILLPAWLIRALPYRRNHDINHASGVIRAHCMSLIKRKRSRMSEGKEGTNDIIEIALKSGAFPDHELVDQLMTFLAAGHETSASAMTWVIYLLCKYPRVQSELRKEIFTCKSSRSHRTEETMGLAIPDNEYLGAVINETLRLFPPVSVTVRVSIRDTVIVGEHIPKGTATTLAPWATNAAFELWGTDALEFVPDRWLKSPKAAGSTGNFSFMTFLHGPRSCIGERFAKAELAFLVAAWVTKFETRLVNEDFVPDIQGGITVKPKDGLHVKVKLLDC
ncbi:hypothetical protein LTR70_010561 [Exophiala xenobiotica]|uniref:Cytochrome P450 n=1 Tax=Lithohypha guttulata TaxID=1690604 RepID=A0ABR0JUG3_9EURO|nr:hypothetical protein LTR24_010513 [Lithohypha guttulata]KAK5309152.1 hypothetical protein LTR70_010561 [Exophiala xenobiotica]